MGAWDASRVLERSLRLLPGRGRKKKKAGGWMEWGRILLISHCAINNNEQWETAVNRRRVGGPSPGVSGGHANEQQPDTPLTGSPLLRERYAMP